MKDDGFDYNKELNFRVDRRVYKFSEFCDIRRWNKETALWESIVGVNNITTENPKIKCDNMNDSNLDEIAILNKAISANEIKDIMKKQRTFINKLSELVKGFFIGYIFVLIIFPIYLYKDVKLRLKKHYRSV